MNALVRFTKLQGRVPSWLCAARKASHAGPALCSVLSRHVHLHSAIDRTSQFPNPPRAHFSSIPRVLLSDSLTSHAADSRDGRKYSRQQLQRAA